MTRFSTTEDHANEQTKASAESSLTNRRSTTAFSEQDRRIEMVPTGRLTPYRGNARTHSRNQIRQIANSIERFGFTNPVLIDDRDGIIAGHGRVAAAQLLDIRRVPALRMSHLSDTEKRAYVLADNKLAEKAGWDREILAIELQGLIELDFEVEAIGFETSEIDIILDDAEEAQGGAAAADDEITDLSFPKIISAHTDDEDLTERVWR